MVITPGTLHAAEEYPLGPDSQRQAGVPQGAVSHYTWTSKIFPGTFRDYWVYVPAQYTTDKPACVMVFQDGEGFMKEDGRTRVPIVFDNLIAKHDMPVTIGILINPGVLKALSPGQKNRSNRSFEYDTLGDRYARFLLDEILPEVAKHYNLSTDPNDRAISGASSGGICSFNVAWNRPAAFRRVLSFIGSFANLRGGDIYPALIRKTEPKPLRVFLQDGSKDLNIFAGDWWLANQSMASALEWAGYEAKFVTGDKDHDMDQGGAILPDALRWLWRDYPKPIAKPRPVHDPRFGPPVLDASSDWQLVNQDKAAWGLATDTQGNVFFSDPSENRIEKISASGTVSEYMEHAGGSGGMMFGPDGRLYVCGAGARRIVGFAPEKVETVVSEGLDCRDLAVDQAGGIYFTDPIGSKVWYVTPAGQKHVAGSFKEPGGVHLSPDQSLLYVNDFSHRVVWSFQVQADGSLANGAPFYRLDINDDGYSIEPAGMAVDSLGFLYVATNLGIQVCDEEGRVQLIINLPAYDPAAGIAFGGPDFQDLYVVAGGKIFKRQMLRKGLLPWVQQKPSVPQP
jgi:sugar lactone lactonase YvrE/enterochelin esterase-like enzyme